MCALPLPISVRCQNAPLPKPVFEAASIKLNPKADGTDSENTPGLLRAQMTLKRYIAYAYDVKDFQVRAGPVGSTWSITTSLQSLNASIRSGSTTSKFAKHCKPCWPSDFS